MANWAVTLSRLVLNQMSRDQVVGIGGGSGITVAISDSSRAFQSERAQLGEAGGALKRGASKRRRMGMWSEPVEGRGSDHSEKYGARRGQAKARSMTPGRPMSNMEKRVKTPSVLRRENPNSVALSKYGADVAISSSLNALRGSDVG